MEYFNEMLCVGYDDLVGIITPEAVRQSVVRGKIRQVRRACNGSAALFEVDSFPHRYRKEIYLRNPEHDKPAKACKFIETIIPDGAAIHYFSQYRFADGRYLDTYKQQEYSNNAALLYSLAARMEAAASHRTKQSQRRLKKADFWKAAACLIAALPADYEHSLPLNPRRLQQKFEQYRAGGYESLISGKFLNRNAAKVDDDVKESVLVQFMADARNLSNAQIVKLYNTVAQSVGWEQISAKPVEVMRKKYDLLTSGGRLGQTRFRAQKSMQVKRSKPTLPLLYWTVDGWTAELLYQKTDVDRKGHSVTTYGNRLVLVVVLDPCVNYPVGYAIGERETPALIREALRNAVNHTRELFGQHFKALQIQSDNYGRGALTPVYKAVSGQYTPARAHNAKAKVIEPYFNYLNRTYCQLQKNWAGFGITSNKNLQPNSEFLNKHRHDFPDAGECRTQLEGIVEAERAAKKPLYTELFAKLPEDKKLALTAEQYLLAFGAETGRKNALEGQGLCPTIEGTKMFYDCFDPRFREYSHVKWTVKYDPHDTSMVLAVNDDRSLRFMLERKHVQPMALADRRDSDAAHLARISGFNRELEESIKHRLAEAHKHTDRLFGSLGGLDVVSRLMLCDSRGQHKDHKQTDILQATDVSSSEYLSPPADTFADNVYDLY